MSRSTRSRAANRRRSYALAFAALGDETRLALLSKLCGGRPHSISELTRGSKLTRQAITKHLHVLEKARVVRCSRSGRERLFQLDPRPLSEMRGYLEAVSAQWDDALARLKLFVEQ